MKWLKERDELIAQTEAFVKSVSARRPAAASPVPPKAAPIGNPFSDVATRAQQVAARLQDENPANPGIANAGPSDTRLLVSSPPQVAERPSSPTPALGTTSKPIPAPKALPVEDAALAQPIEIERVEPSAELPHAEPPAIKAFARGEVRQEIQNRVAAFQANQHRFQREREAYYNAVLTRARSTADGIPDNPQS
jgi:hypothetical protein